MTETASLKKMEEKMQELLIHHTFSIKEAMRQMSRVGERILFVVDDGNHLVGSLTDGDIRKWVLGEGSLAAGTAEVCNKNPITLDKDYDLDSVKKMMLEKKIEGLPVLNRKRQISEVLMWMKVFGKEAARPYEKIDLPVVIMAGGKGTRLDPFTRILPKPLIPIGEKTILEIIISKFTCYGINDFYLSINHRSRMIKAYFEEIKPEFNLKYIEEIDPLGTAGSLRFLESEVNESIIVSNCDIIIESNYHDIVDFHRKRENDITIVGSFRHFSIPYGVCNITRGGVLTDIQEKPEFDFLVNTGMYILKRSVLGKIPKNTFMNITDLIKQVTDEGGQVGVFPVDEKSWIDVGQWEEYHRAIRLLKIKE